MSWTWELLRKVFRALLSGARIVMFDALDTASRMVGLDDRRPVPVSEIPRLFGLYRKSSHGTVVTTRSGEIGY